MAEYFKIDKDTWVKYDNGRVGVLKKSDHLKDKVTLEADIVDAGDLSDSALLKWAKKEYESTEKYKLLPSLKQQLKVIDDDLKEMK